jgi:hypothetical protein
MPTKIGLKYVQVLTSISPSTLRMCSENHRVRAIRRKLEFFYSVAQEQDRFQPVSIFNHIGKITTCQTAIEELKIKSSWAHHRDTELHLPHGHNTGRAPAKPRSTGVQQTEEQKLNQRQGKLKPKNDWETPDGLTRAYRRPWRVAC